LGDMHKKTISDDNIKSITLKRNTKGISTDKTGSIGRARILRFF